MIGKRILVGAVAACCLAATATAAEPLADGLNEFRNGYRDWNQASFWQAARTLRQAADMAPHSATARHWLGVAHFHRLLALRGDPSPRIQQIAAHEMQCAIDALEAAVDLQATDAEAHAVLATLYGMRISQHFMGTVRYGPAVYQHQQLALKHGARNARVQYLLGAALLHTAKDPADRLEALKALLLAEALFDEEHGKRAAQGQPLPSWGHDACLTFIGDAFASLHQTDKAREYYQKSLRLRPDSRAAKAGLQTINQP